MTDTRDVRALAEKAQQTQSAFEADPDAISLQMLADYALADLHSALTPDMVLALLAADTRATEAKQQERNSSASLREKVLEQQGRAEQTEQQLAEARAELEHWQTRHGDLTKDYRRCVADRDIYRDAQDAAFEVFDSLTEDGGTMAEMATLAMKRIATLTDEVSELHLRANNHEMWCDAQRRRAEAAEGALATEKYAHGHTLRQRDEIHVDLVNAKQRIATLTAALALAQGAMIDMGLQDGYSVAWEAITSALATPEAGK